MKVAIIGGGFTGLAAGVFFSDKGDQVTVFEAEKKLGGLAIGFEAPGWKQNLERFYHHIFANDTEAIKMAKKVGVGVSFSTPQTNSFIDGEIRRLDSPLSLLTFDKISFWSRLHMGIGLALLKLISNGIIFENFYVEKTLPILVGRDGYEKVWKPLLLSKFGPFLPQVNMAWFWARIYKRTQSLGYFEGGFQNLADKMGKYIENKGGAIKTGRKVKRLSRDKKGKWWVDETLFDQVLVTTPAPVADKLIGERKIKWPKIDYLWSQTMVLELSESLMNGYWLNILEKDFPFLVVVEHTNFVDKGKYGDKPIVYLGNYLPADDKRLKMNEESLLKLFIPYLKRINPAFDKRWIRKSFVFEAPFSQPVFPPGYSKQIPGIKTGLPNLFIANQSLVYPFDRGSNYAIDLGIKAAQIMKYG